MKGPVYIWGISIIFNWVIHEIQDIIRMSQIIKSYTKYMYITIHYTKEQQTIKQPTIQYDNNIDNISEPVILEVRKVV